MLISFILFLLTVKATNTTHTNNLSPESEKTVIQNQIAFLLKLHSDMLLTSENATFRSTTMRCAIVELHKLYGDILRLKNHIKFPFDKTKCILAELCRYKTGKICLSNVYELYLQIEFFISCYDKVWMLCIKSKHFSTYKKQSLDKFFNNEFIKKIMKMNMVLRNEIIFLYINIRRCLNLVFVNGQFQPRGFSLVYKTIEYKIIDLEQKLFSVKDCFSYLYEEILQIKTLI